MGKHILYFVIGLVTIVILGIPSYYLGVLFGLPHSVAPLAGFFFLLGIVPAVLLLHQIGIVIKEIVIPYFIKK